MNMTPENLNKKTSMNPVSRRETIAGGIILCVFCLIAVSISIKQSYYNRDLFGTVNLKPAETPATGKDIPAESITMDTSQANPKALATNGLITIPEGFIPMGMMETFDEKTLSDKIDGKAELYLENGFKKLVCQRIQLQNKASEWYECFVYDMGSQRNAFTVFSNQRRPKTKPLTYIETGYATENSVNFSTGKYYVEMVSGSVNAGVRKGMDAAAKKLVASQADTTPVMNENAYFPKENLQENSSKLYTNSGFSYDKFDNIMTAVYQIDDLNVTAFISVRKSPAEATELVQGYDKFLGDMGSDPVKPAGINIPGLKCRDLLGDYEYCFSEGKILAGVHAAKKQAAAEKILMQLFNHIKEVDHGSAK